MQGLSGRLMVLLTVNSCFSVSSPQKVQVDEWLLAINGPASQIGPAQTPIDRRSEEPQLQPEQQYQQQPEQQYQQPPEQHYQQSQPQQNRQQQYQPPQQQFQPRPIEQFQQPQRRFEQEPIQELQPQPPVQQFRPQGPALQSQQLQPQNQIRPRPRQPAAPRQAPPRRQQLNPQRPPQNRNQLRRRRPGRPNRNQNNGGLIADLGNAIGGAVQGVQDTFSCGAENLIAESKLNDEEFILSQMRCLQGVQECDDTGRKIRVLAPEVLQKRCPGCKPCTQKQIQRVMSEVQQRYPEEWYKALQEIRKGMRRPG